MTTPLTIAYKCDDGTDFPVVWNNLEDSKYIRVQDNSHWPDAMKPFDAVAWLMGEPGAGRAFEEADIPVQIVFRPHLVPKPSAQPGLLRHCRWHGLARRVAPAGHSPVVYPSGSAQIGALGPR